MSTTCDNPGTDVVYTGLGKKFMAAAANIAWFRVHKRTQHAAGGCPAEHERGVVNLQRRGNTALVAQLIGDACAPLAQVHICDLASVLDLDEHKQAHLPACAR